MVLIKIFLKRTFLLLLIVSVLFVLGCNAQKKDPFSSLGLLRDVSNPAILKSDDLKVSYVLTGVMDGKDLNLMQQNGFLLKNLSDFDSQSIASYYDLVSSKQFTDYKRIEIEKVPKYDLAKTEASHLEFAEGSNVHDLFIWSYGNGGFYLLSVISQNNSRTEAMINEVVKAFNLFLKP